MNPRIRARPIHAWGVLSWGVPGVRDEGEGVDDGDGESRMWTSSGEVGVLGGSESEFVSRSEGIIGPGMDEKGRVSSISSLLCDVDNAVTSNVRRCTACGCACTGGTALFERDLVECVEI